LNQRPVIAAKRNCSPNIAMEIMNTTVPALRGIIGNNATLNIKQAKPPARIRNMGRALGGNGGLTSEPR